MAFALPAFPTSSGSSLFSLPRIPAQIQNAAQEHAPEVATEPCFSLSAKMQLILNEDQSVIKKDKEGYIAFWCEGPSVEFRVKKKSGKQSLKGSKLAINESTVDIILEKETLRVWVENDDFYQLISSFCVVKNTKSDSTKVITKGNGPEIAEEDTYQGRFIQWKLSSNKKFQGKSEFQTFDNETANAKIKKALMGQSEGARIVVVAQKKVLFIEVQLVKKFVRRISTRNVAGRLALMEDRADLLIAKAEQYVKYKRMEKALAKLKKRSLELDAIIDSNSIECENLKKEAMQKQKELTEAKVGINYATADQKKTEAQSLAERADLLSTLNAIDDATGEMELEAMSYEGVKAKFSQCVLSAFGAMSSGLGDGDDFSGDALVSRLNNIQRLIAESFYL